MSDCDFARYTTRSGRVYSACQQVMFTALQLPAMILAAMKAEAAQDDAFESEAQFMTEAAQDDAFESEVQKCNYTPLSVDPTPSCVPEPPSPLPFATPASTPDSEGSSSSRKRKRPSGKPLNRHIRAMKREDRYDKHGHIPVPRKLEKLVEKACVEDAGIDLRELPSTMGGYEAKREDEWEAKVYTLAEAKALGLQVYEWDGRRPVAFVAPNKQIFMVLAGRPDDPQYDSATERVYEALSAKGVKFTSKYLHHRRGDYPTLDIGVSRGQGLPQPVSLKCQPHEKFVANLLANPDIQRMASYASSAFATWAPRTYNYYKTQLDKLFMRMPGLPRIFTKSIFPSMSTNISPQAQTVRHRDLKNCPFGWCAVQAFGHFDPKQGGHLILWELGLAIEFPPGSTILLPSATLSHSNTKILDDEERASLTYYCHGGLFRWVEYDFQIEKDLKHNNPALFNQIWRDRPARWNLGLSLFSTMDELQGGQFEQCEV
ncbi:hypothetical protein JR316_0011531 [Psilocybe cubensis]|uniref:Uncharacterized protein n=2 Tax=Psilocybe cubensis TaxID=181762 RepID=A0A8H7XXD8_PSICU|nr:hypothetical protein JR316_0011531 [Psilocybe cubensis]KAH9475966.1 hypothetical protein JR316_0011531 [Psilocybe cubensis]